MNLFNSYPSVIIPIYIYLKLNDTIVETLYVCTGI